MWIQNLLRSIVAFAMLMTVCSSVGAQSYVPARGASTSKEVAKSINWNSNTIQTVATNGRHKAPVVTGVAIQPNGSLVAIVGDDHIVGLFNRTTGKFDSHLDRHTDWVRSVQFSPSGQHLATAGNDHRVLIWNIENGSVSGEPTELAKHHEVIVAIAWSNDGQQIATVGFEDTIRIYDSSNGSQVASFVSDCKDLRTLAFAKDDKNILAAGRSGKVEIFNIDTLSKVETLALHKQRIRSLAITEQNQLITCGDDRVVKITDLNNVSNVRSLPAHGGKLFTVCPIDEGRLATAGSDNTIYSWDLADLSLAGKLTGHSGTITSLDYRSNTLASGSYDTRVRFWTTEKVASRNALPPFRR